MRLLVVFAVGMLACGARPAPTIVAPAPARPQPTAPALLEAARAKVAALQQIVDHGSAADLAAALDLDPNGPYGPLLGRRVQLLDTIAYGRGALVQLAFVAEQTTYIRWRFLDGDKLVEPIAGKTTLVRVDAHVALTGDALAGEATLTFAPEVHDAVVAVKLAGAEVRASQGGVACRFAESGELLLIERRDATDPHVRITWKAVTADAQNSIDAQEVYLVTPDAWLPRDAGDGVVHYRVAVKRPDALRIFIGGDQREDGGDIVAETELPALYAARDYVTRRVDIDGVSFLLAVWPKDAGRLDPLERALRTVFPRRLRIPYPVKQVNIVETSWNGGATAVGPLGNVGIGNELLQRIELPAYRSVVAHELAHAWFGNRVRTNDWGHGIVNWLQILSLDEDDALDLRKLWSDAGSPVGLEYPLLALEDRYGRAAVLDLVAAFFAAYDGKQPTRADFIAMTRARLGGDAVRAFDLEAPAPVLRLADVTLHDGRVAGRVVADAAPAWAGRVEVGFARLDGAKLVVLGVVPVEVARGTGTLAAPVPTGAELLVLDPRYRTARSYDAHRPRRPQGLWVPLVARCDAPEVTRSPAIEVAPALRSKVAALARDGVFDLVDPALRAHPPSALQPLAPYSDGVLVTADPAIALWAGPDERGRWRVHDVAPPRVLADLERPRLVKRTGVLDVDAVCERIDVDVTLAIDTANQQVLRIRNVPRSANVSVTQDGVPSALGVVPGESFVLVQPAHAAPRVALRFRYRWSSADNTHNAARQDVLVAVRDIAPDLPSEFGPSDLEVRHARGLRLVAPGEVDAPVALPDGRVSTHVRTNGVTWFVGLAGAATRELDVGGVHVTLIVRPENAPQLDTDEKVVRAGLAMLTTALGPYPARTLRIVEAPTDARISGLGSLGCVLVQPRQFAGGWSPKLIAHELAHSYFPGTMAIGLRERPTGDLFEAVPEWLAMHVLDDDDAFEVRADMRAQTSEEATITRGGLLSPRRKLTDEEDRFFEYTKGPMMFVMLEDRIGTARLLQALRGFVAHRAGKTGWWGDLLAEIEAVAGRDATAWFRAWLERPGAPALHLDHVEVKDGAVHARLVQDTQPAFTGTVEVGLRNRLGGLLGARTVAFGATPTEVVLPWVQDAASIVLDPRARLWVAPESQPVPAP